MGWITPLPVPGNHRSGRLTVPGLPRSAEVRVIHGISSREGLRVCTHRMQTSIAAAIAAVAAAKAQPTTAAPSLHET